MAYVPRLFVQKCRVWVKKLEALNFECPRTRDDFVKTFELSIEAYHAEEIYKNTYYESSESQIRCTSYSLPARSRLWGVDLALAKAKE
jgi:hypothetical protein